MHNNAEGHKFPQETEEAMRYIQRAISNIYNEKHPSSKNKLVYMFLFISLSNTIVLRTNAGNAGLQLHLTGSLFITVTKFACQ